MEKSKSNVKKLDEAKKVLRKIEDETDGLRLWTERFRARVESAKGDFEEKEDQRGRKSGL